MKKLMIAAAVAAMVGSGFAGDAPQVYDMTITVKTTQCSGKQAKNVCGVLDENDNPVFNLYYRSQVTKKIYGKFWGCGCCTIAAPAVYGDPEQDNGFMFWVDKDAFHDAEMVWTKLQRVGKTGENVEGIFSLTLSDCKIDKDTGDIVVSESAWLDGAGYGTAKIDCDGEDSYIKSMSGNVVGTWDAASESFTSGCKYCGTEANCTAYTFCESCCDTSDDADKAVVFGSFTLKYNSSKTKALDKGKYIDEAYKFNKYVTAEFACIKAEASGDDDEEETMAERLQKQYTAAKTAYNDAVAATNTQQAVIEDLAKGKTECTKGQELAADVTAAEKDEKDAVNAYTTAYDKASDQVKVVGDAAEALATTNAALAEAKAELAKATTRKDVEALNKKIAEIEFGVSDCTTALSNAKTAAASEATAAANIEKLANKKADAIAKRVEAEQAVTDWGNTGYDAAKKEAADKQGELTKTVEDAEYALEKADLACTLNAVECK